MAVETAKDKIRLSQIMGQKQEVISIDGDVIVNDIKPDVLKIISTNGIVCIYKKEVLNGKVKLEGCINTYIMYLADDETGSIRTINTNLDFAEIIDLENCKEDMHLEDNIILKGFETKILNGRKLHLKAYLDVDLKVYSNTDIEVIANIEDSDGDMQMLNSTKEILSLVDENAGKTTLKDTISIDMQDELAEIMKVSFNLSDIETKTSYNKVLIKANANVGIMYLTEDNRINSVKTKIPIMGFIDMPNVSDTSKCISSIKLKNLILRLNNEEDHSIYIEADLDLYCKVYEKKEFNIIEDLYGIKNDVNLDKVSFRTRTEEFTLRDIIEIREKLTTPEIMYGKILAVNVIPSIESVNVLDGTINYKGNLNAQFILESDNINEVKSNIPFEFKLVSDGITKNSQVKTDINVVTEKIENGDDGVSLYVELEVNGVVQNDEDLSFVNNINILEPENSNTYSMVIYFVKPGDTLWKIAKQFKSRIADIAKVNNIEDENKIYPGEQLYIPKFISNRISI